MPRLVLLVSLLSLLLATPARSALQFDGVDDILIGLELIQYFTTTAKTYMVWFKAEGPSPVGATACNAAESQQIVGHHSSGTSRWLINRRSATILCGLNFAGTANNVSYNSYVDGDVTHATLTHDGTTVILYVNGVNVASTGSGTTTSFIQSLVIGGGWSGQAGPFNGRIDMVGTWNVALSAAEIAAHAGSKRLHMYKTMPTAMWSFDNCGDGTSGAGVVFHDLSGNGRPLTGDDGGNNTGLTCRGSQVLSRHGGIQ